MQTETIGIDVGNEVLVPALGVAITIEKITKPHRVHVKVRKIGENEPKKRKSLTHRHQSP